MYKTVLSVLAVYDNQGHMIAVDIKNVTLGAGETVTRQISCASGNDVAHLGAFVLDPGTLAPLCADLSITF